MSSSSADHRFRAHLDEVLSRVDLVALIGGAVKLRGRGNVRGQCPFHGSKSDSLAVYPDKGFARCWGCQWQGDAIKFLVDHYGLTFREALAKLEAGAGLDGLAAAPVHREKRVLRRPDRERVDSIEFGRRLWKLATPDMDAVRTYLRARGVPDAMLSAERLADVRFVPMGPIVAWEKGGDWRKVEQAPAMVALMRRPPGWEPAGVHATFLAPSLAGKMQRKRRDGSNYPARKMLGPAGGAGVQLPGAGGFARGCPLYVGEGIETVLSGMALAGAGEDAAGLAVLSLGNLEGRPRQVRGALPLYDIEPDPERMPLCFAHAGPVTGLIDADMAPLEGWQNGRGETIRPKVIERKGGPVIERAISSAERSEQCAALFVRAWRAQGAAATAVRPRMGWDFNDAVREGL